MIRKSAAPSAGLRRCPLCGERTFDVGLTGRDWIMENDSDVHVVAELIYSKVSQRPARWVLAVPMDSPVQDIRDLQGKKIATELVNFSKRYFASEGLTSWSSFHGVPLRPRSLRGFAMPSWKSRKQGPPCAPMDCAL